MNPTVGPVPLSTTASPSRTCETQDYQKAAQSTCTSTWDPRTGGSASRVCPQLPPEPPICPHADPPNLRGSEEGCLESTEHFPACPLLGLPHTGDSGAGALSVTLQEIRAQRSRPHARGNTASQQLFPCHLPHSTTPDAFVRAPTHTDGHALQPHPGRLGAQGAPRSRCRRESAPPSGSPRRHQPGKRLHLPPARLDPTSPEARLPAHLPCGSQPVSCRHSCARPSVNGTNTQPSENLLCAGVRPRSALHPRPLPHTPRAPPPPLAEGSSLCPRDTAERMVPTMVGAPTPPCLQLVGPGSPWAPSHGGNTHAGTQGHLRAPWA